MDQKQFISELTAKLKEKGLPLAEEAVIKILETTDEMVSKYVQESESKVDDMILPFFHQLVEFGKKAADKIDGKIG